jgi:hypothetical protein
MGAITTTGRFGAHTVAGLPLAHRGPFDAEPPVALWVSAPVPLSVDEIAAMLYATLEGEACTVAAAREIVTDLTVNGGTSGVAEMLYTATTDRASGCREVAVYWSACLDLARRAIAADVPAPRTRSVLALAAGDAR